MSPKRTSSPTLSPTPGSKKLKLSAPGSFDHLTLPSELEGKIDFKPEFKTGDGRPWNFKIVSWNVNGIRAVVKSQKLSYLKFEDPDVICLQETKCHQADFPAEAQYQGYHKYYNSAEKKGYSSTAIFSKQKPISVTYGINIPEHDNEGRVITAEYETFYVINVYVPNAGQKTVRLPYRQTWNTDFLAYCQQLDSNKPVIVAGDLNVAHTEIDLKNPKSNMKNAGFTKEERRDFTTWLDSGFVDTFRKMHPGQAGAYTFWTYMAGARKRNIGWRLDYFVVSDRLTCHVAASEIREMVMGSDHCPIMLLVADPVSEGGDGEAAEGTELDSNGSVQTKVDAEENAEKGNGTVEVVKAAEGKDEIEEIAAAKVED